MTNRDSKTPQACECADDDPCFCHPELANPHPRYTVRSGQVTVRTYLARLKSFGPDKGLAERIARIEADLDGA